MRPMPSTLNHRNGTPRPDVHRALHLKLSDRVPMAQPYLVVADVMSVKPATINATDSLWRAAKRLVDRSGRLIVVDRSEPVGVLSEDDVLRNWPASSFRARRLRVRELITSRIPCVRPDDDLVTVAAVMDAEATNAIPVVDHTGTPVGLLTREHVGASIARPAFPHGQR